MSILPLLLLTHIRICAKQLPPPALEAVIEFLITNNKNEVLKTTILTQLPNPHFRRVVTDVLDTWYKEAANLDGSAFAFGVGEAIATALSTAAYCEKTARDELSVELVWTGPNLEGTRLRRTEQVLLQLIREAKQELVFVSFAVYKIPDIAKALIAAMSKGVTLRIIAETPEASESKIPFGVSAALGAEIAGQAQLFIWPRDKRLTDTEGRYGSLHIKCVVADSKHLFVSSANLTEYALTLNMEMGLLVHSEELASHVIRHIDLLIQQRILMPYFGRN